MDPLTLSHPHHLKHEQGLLEAPGRTALEAPSPGFLAQGRTYLHVVAYLHVGAAQWYKEGGTKVKQVRLGWVGGSEEVARICQGTQPSSPSFRERLETMSGRGRAWVPTQVKAGCPAGF